jgi:hypothetical protein
VWITHNERDCLTDLHGVRDVLPNGSIKINGIPYRLHGRDGNRILNGPRICRSGDKVDVRGDVGAAPGIKLLALRRKVGVGVFAAIRAGFALVLLRRKDQYIFLDFDDGLPLE